MNIFNDVLISSIKEAEEEFDTVISDDLAENMLAWINGCHENKSMLDGSPPVSNGYKPVCQECTKLNGEIKKLQSDLAVYIGSVAKRRNVSEGCVYIDNGDVFFDG